MISIYEKKIVILHQLNEIKVCEDVDKVVL